MDGSREEDAARPVGLCRPASSRARRGIRGGAVTRPGRRPQHIARSRRVEARREVLLDLTCSASTLYPMPALKQRMALFAVRVSRSAG